MFSNRHDRNLGGTLRFCALAVFFNAFVIGCATPQPMPQPGVTYPDYIVGAPDLLQVTVLPEPAIVEEVVVRPDGKITIQLIGEVQAAGRTPRELGVEIEERIARFKRGARASVSLGAASSHSITVLGEVRGPGTFVLSKQTRVAELLGTAGDVTVFAKLDSIRIVRAGDESTELIPVDLAAIRSGDMSTNMQVLPGDIVYVPPHLLARIGYAINALLFPISPLLGIAQSYIGSAIAL